MRYNKIIFAGILMSLFLMAGMSHMVNATTLWGVAVEEQYYYSVVNLETKGGGSEYTFPDLEDATLKEGSNALFTITSVTESQVRADITTEGTPIASDVIVGFIIDENTDPYAFTETIPLILPLTTFDEIDNFWNSTLWNETIPAIFTEYFEGFEGLQIDTNAGDFGSDDYKVYANVSVEYETVIEEVPLTVTGFVFVELIWDKILGVLEKQNLKIEGIFKQALTSDLPVWLTIERGEVPEPTPGFEVLGLIAAITLLTAIPLFRKRKRS
ncbi:MAG: hypothetical protein ACFFC7_22050 [Candidatus Hermodarchaeota archaeon]